MFPNEVLIDKNEKRKLLELATEANKILEKYEYSSDYSHHTVTCMSRAKTFGKEFLQWCSFLYTNEEKKDGEGDGRRIQSY